MPNGLNILNACQAPLQQLDPDLYNRIMPHINEIAKELSKQELSGDVLSAAVDEFISAVEQSATLSPENNNDVAVAAVSNVFWPAPYRTPGRGRWRYGGGFSTDDLIRYLLLQKLGFI